MSFKLIFSARGNCLTLIEVTLTVVGFAVLTDKIIIEINKYCGQRYSDIESSVEEGCLIYRGTDTY